MYNNVYQEYINNIIGTTPKSQSDFEFDTYRNSNYFPVQNTTTNMELERFYPDLYKLLYPMVQTACMRNTKPITEQTIDEMVNDIHSNFESDNAVMLNINLTNDVRSSSTANNSSKVSNSKSSTKTLSEIRNVENSGERNIRSNNFVLNDLIRILLIRELLGRPGNFPPNRPGFPSQGPGPGRPPFRPRDFAFNSQGMGIYEEPYMYSDFSESHNALNF